MEDDDDASKMQNYQFLLIFVYLLSTGADCSENINECEENPCLHNGTCIDLKPYYECRCHLGYKGQHCEEDIKECKSSPCHNNGQCYEKSDQKLYSFSNKNLPFYGLAFSYANASGYICKCPAGAKLLSLFFLSDSKFCVNHFAYFPLT